MQLVTRRPAKGQRAESEFFTNWETIEKGQWRSDLVNGLLQVAPSKYYGLRSMVQEFHVLEEIQIASSISMANPQFGVGGGKKLFIRYETHATALTPIGELIQLQGNGTKANQKPTGVIAAIIDFEVSLGNKLVAVDRTETPQPLDRFWMQDMLHFSEIKKKLNLPGALSAFQDIDIHGNVTGYVSYELGQILLSPLVTPVKESFWENVKNRIFQK